MSHFDIGNDCDVVAVAELYNFVTHSHREDDAHEQSEITRIRE